MNYHKGKPVPQEIIDSIVSQVLFGERMARKYSNVSIARRCGVGQHFVTKTMQRFRVARQIKETSYNARGSRLRHGKNIWLSPLGS